TEGTCSRVPPIFSERYFASGLYFSASSVVFWFGIPENFRTLPLSCSGFARVAEAEAGRKARAERLRTSHESSFFMRTASLVGLTRRNRRHECGPSGSKGVGLER